MMLQIDMRSRPMWLEHRTQSRLHFLMTFSVVCARNFRSVGLQQSFNG